MDNADTATEVVDTAPEAGGDIESLETTDGVVDEGALEQATEPSDGPTFTVTVDGEEVTVTQDELLKGYQRQADYTRKTQALAADRERIARFAAFEKAMKEDPAGTIEALKQAVGVGAEHTDDDDLDDLDPVERELRELQGWRAQQEAATRQAAIVSEATAAASTLGLEVSAEDLLAFAVKHEIGNLNTAARLLKVELQEQAQAAAQVETVARKRAAAVVGSGASKAPGSAVPPRPKSVREAFALAKSQLNA